MKAFHGDPTVKEKYLARLRAHRAADEIIKGKYWEAGKGCAVGCTIHSGNHSDYETQLGIPMLLARLEDGIFEGLPNEKAVNWPIQFLEAVSIGADLSNIWPKFAIWLLENPEYGVIRYFKEKDKPSLIAVCDGYRKQLEGKNPSIKEWNEIWESCKKVRAAAGAASAYAASAYAAYASAYASAYAAYASAYAASAYASAAGGREKTRTAQSEKLLELLKEATP